MRPLSAMRAPRRLWQQLRRNGAAGLQGNASRLALVCTPTPVHTEWAHSRHVHSSSGLLHKPQQTDATAANTGILDATARASE